jgi:uncharacterized protein YybS (DUF2232 family)
MKKETRRLTECSLLTAIAVVIYLSTLIPGIGFFTILLCCIPSEYITLLYGLKWGTISSIAATILIALTVGPLEGIGYLSLFAITGVSLGALTRRGNSPLVIIGGSTLAVLGSMLFSVYIVEHVLGLNETWKFFEEMSGYLTSISSYTNQFWIFTGLNDPSSAEEITTSIQTAILLKLPIAIFVIISFLIVYGNYVAAAIVFRRLNIPWEDVPNPFTLKAPLWMMPLALLGYIIPDSFFANGGLLEIVLVNFLAVAWFYFYLTGFVLMSYAFNYYHVPRLLRLPIMFLLIVPLRLVLIIIAATDSLIDIRKLTPSTDIT